MEDGSLATILSFRWSLRKVLGSSLGTTRPNGYQRDDIKVAVSLTAHLALAIDRGQQTQQLQHANQELARLASFRLNRPPSSR